MNILHTESSNGWGGQEIRILKEALGLRARGHRIVFVTTPTAKLAHHAVKEGFVVERVDFRRSRALTTIPQLMRVIKKYQIDVVNTHSSSDAWLGGIAARLARCKVVRTRHLSTPVRGGLNAWLLYRSLADFVVTTSSAIIPKLSQQTKLPLTRFKCVATGVDPFHVDSQAALAFRDSLGVKPDEILIGTVCVVRSWKGIQHLIEAAKQLRHHPHLKWVVVGGGYIDHFKHLVDPSLPFIFTGHLDNPYPAIAALDIFTLLSTAHEGISQASLQAAFLKKPLITTTIGGLPEVCLDGKTGVIVPPASPSDVAAAVLKLASSTTLREQFGEAAHAVVEEKFTMRHTLDQMEALFKAVINHDSV